MIREFPCAKLRLLRWRQVDLLEKAVTVGKSKTAGGEGRIIPLSETAFSTLREWRGQFPEALPAHFVFPTEKYGFSGEDVTRKGSKSPTQQIRVSPWIRGDRMDRGAQGFWRELQMARSAAYFRESHG